MKTQIVYTKIVVLFIIIWGAVNSTLAQSCYVPPTSVKPTTKGVYVNPSIIWDAANSCYRFNCYSADTISYAYYTNKGGTLLALKMEKGSTNFWPSYYSSPILHVTSNNTNILGWNSNVNYTLTSINTNADTLIANWKMKYLLGANKDSLNYTYKFHIEGKTLVLVATSSEAKCAGFNLDRSEGMTNVKLIPVPYYLGSNIAKTGSYYVSTFTDWETSNASQFTPSGGNYNSSSAYYAQFVTYSPKSNGVYNLLSERIYFTVSKDLTETLPNLINPISPNADSSANRIVYDQWTNCCPWSFTMVGDTIMSRMYKKGVRNLWFIDHQWQNKGYDIGYPDVLPAYAGYGGNAKLKQLADSCHKWGYKFTLHENYWDYSKSAPVSFTFTDVALSSGGGYAGGTPNYLGDTMYLLKNTKINKYINNISPQIHSTFNTDGAYLDVHSAANPFYGVDYDASVSGAGKYTEVIKNSRAAGPLLRTAHGGNALISGEGRFHYMYTGYYDDFEAEIETGFSNGYGGYYQGVRLPLLVDFKLNKMHVQTPMHGVGYYERFFSDPSTGQPSFFYAGKDTTLIYMATELAYGNCAFIPRFGSSKNVIQIAQLEYQHTFKVQKYYYNQCATSILYNDNGSMLTSSQYINTHPTNFDSISSPNFLSQVKVQYGNGVQVFVNRNRFKPWSVSLSTNTGTLSYHAIVNGKDSLYYGTSSLTSFTLPPQSGWLVYIPYNVTGQQEMTQLNENKMEVSCYPNPFNDEINIMVNAVTDEKGSIKIFDITGRQVFDQAKHFNKGANLINWNGTGASGTKCASGMYFIKVYSGSATATLKVVKE